MMEKRSILKQVRILRIHVAQGNHVTQSKTTILTF